VAYGARHVPRHGASATAQGAHAELHPRLAHGRHVRREGYCYAMEPHKKECTSYIASHNGSPIGICMLSHNNLSITYYRMS